MSYMVVLEGTDLNDEESNCAVAETVEQALNAFETAFGFEDGARFDVYYVADVPTKTVQVNKEVTLHVEDI